MKKKKKKNEDILFDIIQTVSILFYIVVKTINGFFLIIE
jgi:hypothetical protein